MQCDENTASTLALSTPCMSCAGATMSGHTAGSASRRNSDQSGARMPGGRRPEPAAPLPILSQRNGLCIDGVSLFSFIEVSPAGAVLVWFASDYLRDAHPTTTPTVNACLSAVSSGATALLTCKIDHFACAHYITQRAMCCQGLPRVKYSCFGFLRKLPRRRAGSVLLGQG